MKIIAKSIITISTSLFLFSLSITLFAQNNEKAVVEKLPKKDKEKVAKSEKWLSKGNLILEEASKYDSELASLKEAEGKLKMRKINKLEKKSDGLKIKAASYLQDGYKKKAKVFESIVKDSRKTNPQLASRLKEVEFNSDKKIKKSKKLYRKADDMASKSKAVEYFELGHKNYEEAIAILCGGLVVVYDIEAEDEMDNIVAEEDTTMKNDSTAQEDIGTDVSEEMQDNPINSETDNPAVSGAVVGATATTAAVVAAANSGNEKKSIIDSTNQAFVTDTIPLTVEPEEKENINVFFTIQFVADKKPVSSEMQKTKYAGELEVVEMNAGGWYRYSVGRFTKLEEAKAMMKSEGIKGFIVAYKSGERITVSEAVELLK